MVIKLLRLGIVGLVMMAANAWAAGNSSFQGEVKDSTGKPVAGAEVHIKPRGEQTDLKITRTDSNGRYLSSAVPAGTYEVTLIVNGTVKASIHNSVAQAGKPTDLNFKLTGQVTTNNKKHTHMVYVPGETGSHMGGHWVEVNDTGDNGAATATAAGAQHLSGDAIKSFGNNTGSTGGQIGRAHV